MLSQTLVLFRELPDDEWLAAQQGSRFRATAEFVTGSYAGLGIVTTEEPHLGTLKDLHVELRQRGLGRAHAYGAAGLLIPPLPIPVAHIPPGEIIAFLLLNVSYGLLEEYNGHLEGVSGDVGLASARLFGNAEHNVCIEVVGSDPDEVARVMNEIVSHRAVRSVEVLQTTGDLVAGFGDPAS